MGVAIFLQYLDQMGVELRVGKKGERVLIKIPEEFCAVFEKECGREAAGQLNIREITFGEIQRLIKFLTVPASAVEPESPAEQEIIDDLLRLQTARNAKKSEQKAAKEAKKPAKKSTKA
jgi:hypothetical protein